tara:strand:- start:683 stop:1342 length:660 start_codon:yes stop_codon:yes gene_type:complete
MSNTLNRRDFLRNSTLAVTALQTPNLLSASSTTKVESEALDLQETVDFSAQFIGEGLDRRPLSYWPHINFFDKDENFYEAEGTTETIVEFQIFSTFGDFEWLTARKEDSRIFYQLVTEYGEVMAYTQPYIYSEHPLTLGELISFIEKSNINGALYDTYGVVRNNWFCSFECDGDPEQALKFMRIESAQYPDLAPHYEKVGRAWADQILKEREEDEYGEV